MCVWCGVGPFRPADDMEVQGIGRREDDFVGGGRHVAMKRNRKVAIKWIMQRVVSVSGTLVCPRQRVEIGATVGGDSLGVTHPETQKVYSPPLVSSLASIHRP